MSRGPSYNDLDNVMDTLNSLEDRENRERGFADSGDASYRPNRTEVGMVEHYYSKLGVAAIKLTDTLKVGDLIEIGSDEEAIRQRITSMQIDRNDVNEAYPGQSIGVKVKHPVAEGSGVYKM